MTGLFRLAVVSSHPVQYYAPIFRELAKRLNLTVFYAHLATPTDQAQAGFDIGFDWDIDLLFGYAHQFMKNVARAPNLDHFTGVDTPEIGRRLFAGDFDAVLLMGWHLKCFHQALWAAKRLRIPVFARGDSHLDTPRAAWKRCAKAMIYPVFLRCFDAALAVGQRNRAYWQHYGYPDARIFDAPHCIDNDWFGARATPAARADLRARLGVTSDAKLVLLAGKLIPVKRPLDLVEAAAVVRGGGEAMELLVAGAGPLEPNLRARAAALGVPLHSLGFCNQTEMPAVYAACDLLVLPSESETWGLVVNEALACGRPILVSDAVGCAPDLAAHLGDGAVFPMGNISALVARLRGGLEDPLDLGRIATAAAAFSLEAACSGIEAAVHALATGRGRAS